MSVCLGFGWTLQSSLMCATSLKDTNPVTNSKLKESEEPAYLTYPISRKQIMSAVVVKYTINLFCVHSVYCSSSCCSKRKLSNLFKPSVKCLFKLFLAMLLTWYWPAAPRAITWTAIKSGHSSLRIYQNIYLVLSSITTRTNFEYRV